jgi:hypothetical protein
MYTTEFSVATCRAMMLSQQEFPKKRHPVDLIILSLHFSTKEENHHQAAIQPDISSTAHYKMLLRILFTIALYPGTTVICLRHYKLLKEHLLSRVESHRQISRLVN